MKSYSIYPSKFAKHFLFNLKNDSFEFIINDIYYSLSKVTDKLNVSFDDSLFDCASMTLSRYKFRHLLVTINHFLGKNLYEKVCNYFLIHPLHSDPYDFLYKYIPSIFEFDYSFVVDIYFYCLYDVILTCCINEDLISDNDK